MLKSMGKLQLLVSIDIILV